MIDYTLIGKTYPNTAVGKRHHTGKAGGAGWHLGGISLQNREWAGLSNPGNPL